jgi:DinB superfamily
MTGHLTIKDIEVHLHSAEKEFSNYCSSLSDEQFFYQPEGKWSPAQQVRHLITATNMARLPFILPGFMVRLFAGKPNRRSRTFDELVDKYKLKLEKGGRASGRYVPKPIHPAYGKEKLISQFTKAIGEFISALKKNKDETMPDNFIAPHPLLGKITLRELCYFTIYHTHHHLQSIKTLTESVTSV